MVGWDCFYMCLCTCMHPAGSGTQSAEGTCPEADSKRNSEIWRCSLLLIWNYLLQWELTFTEELTLGKGGGDEGGKLLLVFWWLQVLSFIYSIFTGKILLDSLTWPLALKDQRLLHSKEWEDILYSTILLSLWLLSKGGSSNGVSSDVPACPQETKLKHLPLSVYKFYAMCTIHTRVGHCHEKLCGKSKDEFW